MFNLFLYTHTLRNLLLLPKSNSFFAFVPNDRSHATVQTMRWSFSDFIGSPNTNKTFMKVWIFVAKALSFGAIIIYSGNKICVFAWCLTFADLRSLSLYLFPAMFPIPSLSPCPPPRSSTLPPHPLNFINTRSCFFFLVGHHYIVKAEWTTNSSLKMWDS